MTATHHAVKWIEGHVQDCGISILGLPTRSQGASQVEMVVVDLGKFIYLHLYLTFVYPVT